MLFDLLIRPFIARTFGPECAHGDLAHASVTQAFAEELNHEALSPEILWAHDAHRELLRVSTRTAC